MGFFDSDSNVTTIERTVADIEGAIRDLAATVVNQVRTREHHPTYLGKTEIRNSYQRLVGAVGLYSFLTHQSMHPQSWTPQFRDPRAQTLIDDATRAVDSL